MDGHARFMRMRTQIRGWTAAGLLSLGWAGTAEQPASLAERLGYRATDRLLIVNGDDAGMCHAANAATISSLDEGLMTSATIMVPCGWFNEMAEYARRQPERSLGVHLCHTAEWKLYRWGPVAPREQVPGLVGPDGYFWRSVQEVYAQARPEEALVEGRAQVRKALAAGIDVSHLDSHMGTLQYDPRYLEVYLKLAVEFDLPVRMASQSTLERFNQAGLRQRFAQAGIVFPDYLVYEELQGQTGDVKALWMRVLKQLRPGVTELYIHAAKPTEELQAITGSWRTRAAEYEVFTHDAEVKQLLAEEKIVRIGYRPLRELQRRERGQGAGRGGGS
ncbi:MAG: ChbG/HpnK family deacetylase [Verrucomicrobia bacterium]|nr:ChbG/HpnK family deacetylase [Verrucomicrobiota bacterium]